MEEIREVKPKKKRPRPEGATAKPAREQPAGERPKKKRPRPEGAEVKKPSGKPAAAAPVPEDTKKKKKKRKKRKKRRGIISTIILVIALAVFAYSAFQLYVIFKGYQDGQNEYEDVIALAIEENDKNEDEFKVNFDELIKINQDTVGWIRFYPEPKQINYPVVQGPDNDLYLHKTFSANENTVGSIFVNVYNNPDFNDKHTIVYGHRMNDDTMFHDLAKYADKEFWENNPNFYIYTTDGRKITYDIYAAGEVLVTSDSYRTEFADDDEFQNFIYLTEQESKYATGVDVETNDTVVTLSTCVKGKEEYRFVVRGVKVSEEKIN